MDLPADRRFTVTKGHPARHLLSNVKRTSSSVIAGFGTKTRSCVGGLRWNVHWRNLLTAGLSTFRNAISTLSGVLDWFAPRALGELRYGPLPSARSRNLGRTAPFDFHPCTGSTSTRLKSSHLGISYAVFC